MKTLSKTVVITMLALVASFPARGQDQLVGVTFFGNELISINPSTGSGTLIGSLGDNVSPFGVAANAGSLYTYNPNTSRIQGIDPATGHSTSSINIGVSGIQGEGDLAFRADGVGFLAAALSAGGNPTADLYTFNLASGTSTRIGSTGQAVDGLAFDGNVLYAVGQGDGRLFTVNQSNGSLTPVGSLGVNQNSPVAGLTVGPNGQLYGAIDDRLYTINKLTGAATPVDASVLDLGFSSVSGIASVPEPSTTTLMVVSAGAVLAFLRRRKVNP
jgi:hypothetical protein